MKQINPSKEYLEIIKEIVKQNSIIIESLFQPMFGIEVMDEESMKLNKEGRKLC